MNEQDRPEPGGETEEIPATEGPFRAEASAWPTRVAGPDDPLIRDGEQWRALYDGEKRDQDAPPFGMYEVSEPAAHDPYAQPFLQAVERHAPAPLIVWWLAFLVAQVALLGWASAGRTLSNAALIVWVIASIVAGAAGLLPLLLAGLRRR